MSDLQKGRKLLNDNGELSAKQLGKKLSIQPRTVRKARQGSNVAIERVGRKEDSPHKIITKY